MTPEGVGSARLSASLVLLSTGIIITIIIIVVVVIGVRSKSSSINVR